MGQLVAQAPLVTDDLQEALRKALHDHRHILTAVHEKNKANVEVTETLLTHVDSQKDASSSKKQKSSWKPPEASSSKKQKPFWRPPRFCYACHMRTYLGAGHGCANLWCPSVRPQGPARSWSSNSWQWQADDQSASAKRANQGEQDQPSAEQAEAGGSGGVRKEEEETCKDEGKGGWQFGQPWSLWGRSNPEGERQQDEGPQDESKQAEDWPQAEDWHQANGQQQQHHQSGTSASNNWWGGGSSQPSGGSGWGQAQHEQPAWWQEWKGWQWQDILPVAKPRSAQSSRPKGRAKSKATGKARGKAKAKSTGKAKGKAKGKANTKKALTGLKGQRPPG